MSTSDASQQFVPGTSLRAESSSGPNWSVLVSMSVATLAIHLLFYRGYGFFRDELYFIACSHRLAWGFPDQPPGAPFAAWLSWHLFGETLFAIRSIPSLLSAVQTLFAGLTAYVMGGKRFAQLFACVCILAAPQYFVSYLNTDIFIKVGWAICAYLAALILSGYSPRLWVLFGLVAGLSLYGKDSMFFFLFSFLIGVLISPRRRVLLNPWLWIGFILPVIIFTPNLLWQAHHGWPELQLLNNVNNTNKNIVLSPWEFFVSNSKFLSLASLPVWLGGVIWCIVSSKSKNYRAFGWMWVVAFITFVLLKGKSYYLAPVYPALFAAGAVAFGELTTTFNRNRTWLRVAAISVILLAGMLRWPFAVGFLPVPIYIQYAKLMGTQPAKYEKIDLNELPQMYADQFGWPEMAAAVGKAYNTLSPVDKARCGILTRNYGEAAALEFYGSKYGLPRVISPHNSYYTWGPGAYTGECLLEVGSNRTDMDKLFANVVQVGETYQEYAIPFENHRPIWLVREPKFTSLQQIWPQLKIYR